MTIQALIDALPLRIICAPEDASRTFDNIYVGDLLSRAMSRVQDSDLWITIMNNKNVVAVAQLTDAPAVLLAEDVELTDDAVQAARDNGITVLSSPCSAYELCRDISRILQESV